MTYAAEYLKNAAEVAAAYPDERTTFALAAAETAVWGADPLEVAAKRIARRDNRFVETLAPMSVDYGAGRLERSAAANVRIVCELRRR